MLLGEACCDHSCLNMHFRTHVRACLNMDTWVYMPNSTGTRISPMVSSRPVCSSDLMAWKVRKPHFFCPHHEVVKLLVLNDGKHHSPTDTSTSVSGFVFSCTRLTEERCDLGVAQVGAGGAALITAELELLLCRGLGSLVHPHERTLNGLLTGLFHVLFICGTIYTQVSSSHPPSPPKWHDAHV